MIIPAAEMYQEEIVHPNMEHLSIGHGKDWDSKEDFIECKILEWLNTDLFL